jgi:hypothetical protein
MRSQRCSSLGATSFAFRFRFRTGAGSVGSDLSSPAGGGQAAWSAASAAKEDTVYCGCLARNSAWAMLACASQTTRWSAVSMRQVLPTILLTADELSSTLEVTRPCLMNDCRKRMKALGGRDGA